MTPGQAPRRQDRRARARGRATFGRAGAGPGRRTRAADGRERDSRAPATAAASVGATGVVLHPHPPQRAPSSRRGSRPAAPRCAPRSARPAPAACWTRAPAPAVAELDADAVDVDDLDSARELARQQLRPPRTCAPRGRRAASRASRSTAAGSSTSCSSVCRSSRDVAQQPAGGEQRVVEAEETLAEEHVPAHHARQRARRSRPASA